MIDPTLMQRWLLMAAALLAAALLGALGLERHNAYQQDIGAQRERALCRERALQADHAARAREMNWTHEVSDAQAQAQKNRDLATAAQRSAADAGRVLSDTLAQRLERTRESAPDADHQYLATVSAVLDQCQSAYRDLAVQADGHAADSLMLQQAWPR